MERSGLLYETTCIFAEFSGDPLLLLKTEANQKMSVKTGCFSLMSTLRNPKEKAKDGANWS